MYIKKYFWNYIKKIKFGKNKYINRMKNNKIRLEFIFILKN